MSKAPYARDEASIERALSSIRRDIAWPPEPDLAGAVRAAIETAPGRAPRRSWVPRRAFALATAIVVVLATLTLSLSPAARHAVADWLGIGGVRIGRGPGPTPTAAPGSNLALGTRVTLASARAEVDFPIVLPTRAGLEVPGGVFVSPIPPGGRVSLVYEANESLPNTDETDLGMIITEFRASITPDFGKKIVGAQGSFQPTEVDGAFAYWITGPHTFYIYEDSEGQIREDTVRLAGNALLWERDGITYRIESSLDMRAAIRIAESMS